MKNPLGVADYGMNVWYGGCFNLEQRLELLKSCGVAGIEWLRAGDMAEAVQNASTFHRMGMDFASCKMSSPELTMKCASAFGKQYIWIEIPCLRDVPFDVYCRRANAFVQAADFYGIRAALHNHLGTRVQSQQELENFLEAVPGAAFLLDIAHLHAANGDCVEVVNKYHDRLAAVHFKDLFLNDDAGMELCARVRFCELGAGNAGLNYEAIARTLMDCHYDQWILIEHDTHLRPPEIDIKTSAEILKGLFA
ncbi:MAG: sugar phosphate isomerase/epimerase [Lentisphaeria bacterium]|nr:sugar phosphate isomerase/epimerase [Lentisphaeria bacterium]